MFVALFRVLVQALLRKYERELKKLRHELDTRNQTLVDKRKLLELEDQKKRAEQDKIRALMTMEKLSQSLQFEKEQKNT